MSRKKPLGPPVREHRPALADVLDAVEGIEDTAEAVEVLHTRGLWPDPDPRRRFMLMSGKASLAPQDMECLLGVAALGRQSILTAEESARVLYLRALDLVDPHGILTRDDRVWWDPSDDFLRHFDEGLGFGDVFYPDWIAPHRLAVIEEQAAHTLAALGLRVVWGSEHRGGITIRYAAIDPDAARAQPSEESAA